MRRQTALQHLFDGLYLIDAKGKVVAESPEALNMIGMDVSSRSYFQQASGQLTPFISEPYRSYDEGKPAVMVTAPVFDHQKRFIGLLGGTISLAGKHLIEGFSSIRIGKTGYLAIVARNGIMLAHGRTGEVMRPLKGITPMLQSAMDGFEGTAQSRDSDGDPVILSVQQMSEMPWFVAAVWPAREAYAPVTRMKDAFLWILLAVILLIVPLALWRFRRLMAPLHELGQQVHERHLGVRSNPVGGSGGSEIRQVADIFNMVMDERDDVMSSLADLSGTHLFDCVSDDDRGAVINGWQQAIKRQDVFRDRLRLQGLNASTPVWCQVMTASLETPEKVMGTITVVRAKTLAERIRAGVESLKVEQNGRMFGVTASMGMTELVPADRGPKGVVARADEGIYVAKSKGRNRVVVMPAP